MTAAPEPMLDTVVSTMGGARRPSQHDMVARVADAFDNGSLLMVQAGTGTGKSLGYIVPAVHAALARGERTVIATATLALQRQLTARDLPTAVAALELDDRVSFALLKGRGNYLCRARLAGQGIDPQEELQLGGSLGSLERQAQQVRSWAVETATGDRDDYPDPVDSRVWRALSATGRECIGPSKCAFAADCFSEAARARAADADVIVTNHAMVALDAVDDTALLPEYDHLVVDEAHELAARVTAAGTQGLTVSDVERAAGAARPLVGEDSVTRFAEAVAALDASFDSLGEDRTRLTELPRAVVAALASVRDACSVAVAELPADGDSDPVRRQRALAAIEEVHDVAGRLLACADTDVIWFARSPQPGLSVAPLDVAAAVSRYLRDRRSAVMTSATLTIGGDFDAVATQLGVTDAAGVDVGSPFNYPEQAILYVAADLAPPGRDSPDERMLARIRELVSAAGGRTLVLLSSWRAVDRVAAHLAAEPLDGVTVLVQQRGDPVAVLVERFATEETSVLVGTASLFQGVDVPGRSCISVIIDRIPFPRPDDPVLQARAQVVERQGGNGFVTVSVPRAALMLAQAAGRLIRTDSDRGVVTVLDSRLASARYASYLVRSLPPLWRTSDRSIALAALGRLAGADAESVPG